MFVLGIFVLGTFITLYIIWRVIAVFALGVMFIDEDLRPEIDGVSYTIRRVNRGYSSHWVDTYVKTSHLVLWMLFAPTIGVFAFRTFNRSVELSERVVNEIVRVYRTGEGMNDKLFKVMEDQIGYFAATVINISAKSEAKARMKEIKSKSSEEEYFEAEVEEVKGGSK